MSRGLGDVYKRQVRDKIINKKFKRDKTMIKLFSTLKANKNKSEILYVPRNKRITYILSFM